MYKTDMKTDLRQNRWTDSEKELLLSSGLTPLTIVYFHKETENEIITCFKNSDETFLLTITNKGQPFIPNKDNSKEVIEETFESLEDVFRYNTIKKLRTFVMHKEAKRIFKEIQSDYNKYYPKENTEALKQLRQLKLG